jgi:hypothetical protein
MFWDGILFINIAHEVICAPDKIIANNPDFLISARKGVVVAFTMAFEIEPKLLIIFFYV